MSAEWPLVNTGDAGASVKALQRLLVHRGASLGVDGIFGPETEGAVKASSARTRGPSAGSRSAERRPAEERSHPL